MFIENFLRNVEFKGKRRLIKKLFSPKQGILNYSKSKFYYDTFELICFEMYWCGGYEKEVTWIYDHIIHAKTVCVDLGANIGVHTILLCERAKHVHAFEPHPIFKGKLEKNLILNSFKNFQIHQVGISNFDGSATLHSPPDSMANKSASIYDANSDLSDSFTIAIKKLDQFNATIPKVDFIKIDCDGSDGAIILSGREMILHSKPSILFEDAFRTLPEDHAEAIRIRKEFSEAYKFLFENSYKLFVIKNGYLIPLQSEPAESYQNVLAVHRDNSDLINLEKLVRKIS